MGQGIRDSCPVSTFDKRRSVFSVTLCIGLRRPGDEVCDDAHIETLRDALDLAGPKGHVFMIPVVNRHCVYHARPSPDKTSQQVRYPRGSIEHFPSDNREIAETRIVRCCLPGSNHEMSGYFASDEDVSVGNVRIMFREI
jgi:hypothetical protein